MRGYSPIHYHQGSKFLQTERQDRLSQQHVKVHIYIRESQLTTGQKYSPNSEWECFLIKINWPGSLSPLPALPCTLIFLSPPACQLFQWFLGCCVISIQILSSSFHSANSSWLQIHLTTGLIPFHTCNNSAHAISWPKRGCCNVFSERRTLFLRFELIWLKSDLELIGISIYHCPALPIPFHPKAISFLPGATVWIKCHRIKSNDSSVSRRWKKFTFQQRMDMQLWWKQQLVRGEMQMCSSARYPFLVRQHQHRCKGANTCGERKYLAWNLPLQI